jgi:hypothetical protein
MNKQNNSGIWIILGIIALIVILNSYRGLFSTVNTCTSNEPSDFSTYVTSINNLLQSNSCSLFGESKVNGIACLSINIFNISNSNNPCLNNSFLISQFNLVNTYKNVNIYYPKLQTQEPSTSCYYICTKNDFVVIGVNQSIINKYIDYFYTCSNNQNNSTTNRNFFTDFIDYLNGKNVNSTSYTLYWIIGIGLLVLILITKQWWLLIIYPLAILIGLSGISLGG